MTPSTQPDKGENVAKFTLREPPRWKNSLVNVHVLKPEGYSRDEHLTIRLGDDSEVDLMKFEIEPDTKALKVTPLVDDPSMLKIVGATLDGGSRTSFTPQGGSKIPRSWAYREDEDTGDRFFDVHYKGRTISVPALPDKGPATPTGAFEIYGQDLVLFSLAAGFVKERHTMLTGPTNTGKTSIYTWVAQMLGWNIVIMPVTPSTEAAHLVGEYLPDGSGKFSWTDGPVTRAARLSQDRPTILVFDELTRIGRVAELARIYSLLDDRRELVLDEKRDENGEAEVIKAGQLFIGATANPPDDEGADYVGVVELDPALVRRFGIQPHVTYPDAAIEVGALQERVPGLSQKDARAMVQSANRIRSSANVRFPIGMSQLIVWGQMLPYFDYNDAAEIAVVQHAPPIYRADIRNLLKLQG